MTPSTWAEFGSRMTSPEVVVPAGIAGSVPNFFALGSLGSITPDGARYRMTSGTLTSSVFAVTW